MSCTKPVSPTWQGVVWRKSEFLGVPGLCCNDVNCPIRGQPASLYSWSSHLDRCVRRKPGSCGLQCAWPWTNTTQKVAP